MQKKKVWIIRSTVNALKHVTLVYAAESKIMAEMLTRIKGSTSYREATADDIAAAKKLGLSVYCW